MIRSYGAYCIYDNAILSLDTENIKLSVTDLYGYAEKYGMSGSENYILAVAIDTTYPAQDVLHAGYERYHKLQPVAWLTLVSGLLGIVGYLGTLVLLTMKAGIDPDHPGLQLSWFDSWKTEIAVLAIGVLAFVCHLPVIILNKYFSSNGFSLISAGIKYGFAIYLSSFTFRINPE